MKSESSPIGVETLDTPTSKPELVRATLNDIAVSNALFGGRAAVAYGVRLLVRDACPEGTLTLLDVGAGMGDVANYLARRSRRWERIILPVTADWHPEAARMCREGDLLAVVGDAAALPFSTDSVDIVVASQLLHHFTRAAAVRLVRGFVRIARLGVVIADLERARTAALGIWLASLALRFHPVTRHDGVVSVRRGFRPEELARLLQAAGVNATVRRRPGYRLVAAWKSPNGDT